MRLPTSYTGHYPFDGVEGQGRDKETLRYWAERASRNSRVAPRAKGGAISLPDTGGKVELHDTAAKPPVDHGVEAAMISGSNFGDDYL